MSLEDIWHFAPKTWNRSYNNNLIPVLESSDEYADVENDIKKACINNQCIQDIRRYQNIYDFGQFLLRGQILCSENPGTQYYAVRRYVEVPKAMAELAMKHNLDHRRIQMNALEFRSHLTNGSSNSDIYVVKILTTDPKARCIVPYNFTEYYIEYIIYR
ncbi:hypothetical protein WA026_001471 [Henosepilachna vigintioctopunctata]|uniref:Uncharacterized protein n=1 Tax=Henosepilachna vigintioctopunctata TaxID=420089 RepID=A0AAW1UQ13_9CUCU